MEFLVLIGIGVFIWYTFFKKDVPRQDTRNYSENLRNSTQHESKHKSTQKTFNVSADRGRSRTRSSKISFKNSGSTPSKNEKRQIVICPDCGAKSRAPAERSVRVTCPKCFNQFELHVELSSANKIDLDGINDAFTGVQIDENGVIYTCSCGVFYQGSSFELLQSENSSNCVACGKADISLYSRVSQTKSGKSSPRNYNPNSVTLQNYHKFTNQVVTFEGLVQAVNISRRGTDYAVMFENKSWSKGFKLVFFKGTVRKVGGPKFINSLKGKNLKVRGLLIKHKTFGYEIIINDRAMILEIG